MEFDVSLDFYNNLQKIYNKIRKLLHDKYSLSLVQVSYLFAIFRSNEKMRMNELIQYFDVDKAGATRTVLSLIKLGYLTKDIEFIGQKKYTLSLTTKGIDLVKKILNDNSIISLSNSSHLDIAQQRLLEKCLISFSNINQDK